MRRAVRRAAAWLGMMALLVPLLLPLLHAGAMAAGDVPFGALCRAPADGVSPDDASSESPNAHLKVGCPICQAFQTLGGALPPLPRLDAPEPVCLGAPAYAIPADRVATAWSDHHARPRAPPALS